MRLALLLALTLASPLMAQERYLTLFVGSEHFGDDTLNNFNPGLGIGWRSDGPWGLEQAYEFGVFYNSYEEVAPIGIYSLSAEVARPSEDISLRAGGFVGAAYYDALSEVLEDQYGLPNIGGVIPILGVSGALRYRDTTDMRLTLVPPGAGVDAIVNLSLARRF
ncbi:hypothetical protein [Roseobacter sp. HKCCA0434]|uniref:hypothetical protein n=1 Tax=Roseobacter sp. HKCCA0434 TaxID=3079297 RepID=UPI0029058B2D|nr:hypothetical protein [Roseobacter sp. HKCCA0434]